MLSVVLQRIRLKVRPGVLTWIPRSLGVQPAVSYVGIDNPSEYSMSNLTPCHVGTWTLAFRAQCPLGHDTLNPKIAEPINPKPPTQRRFACWGFQSPGWKPAAFSTNQITDGLVYTFSYQNLDCALGPYKLYFKVCI